MTMWLLFVLLLGFSLIPIAVLVGRALFRHRGTRVVTCPETGMPAAVRVDGSRVLASTAIGEPDLRLKECSRWPERRACRQACLSQVESAPAECVVRTMLVDWYQGASCALCGRGIGEVHWVEHKPALLTPDRETVEWEDVTPETLERVLATHQRVCWSCHAANAWRERFPGFRAGTASSPAS